VDIVSSFLKPQPGQAIIDFKIISIKQPGASTTIRQRKPNWTDSEGRPPEGLSPRMGEIKRNCRSDELYP